MAKSKKKSRMSRDEVKKVRLFISYNWDLSNEQLAQKLTVARFTQMDGSEYDAAVVARHRKALSKKMIPKDEPVELQACFENTECQETQNKKLFDTLNEETHIGAISGYGPGSTKFDRALLRGLIFGTVVVASLIVFLLVLTKVMH